MEEGWFCKIMHSCGIYLLCLVFHVHFFGGLLIGWVQQQMGEECRRWWVVVVVVVVGVQSIDGCMCVDTISTSSFLSCILHNNNDKVNFVVVFSFSVFFCCCCCVLLGLGFCGDGFDLICFVCWLGLFWLVVFNGLLLSSICKEVVFSPLVCLMTMSWRSPPPVSKWVLLMMIYFSPFWGFRWSLSLCVDLLIDWLIGCCMYKWELVWEFWVCVILFCFDFVCVSG